MTRIIAAIPVGIAMLETMEGAGAFGAGAVAKEFSADVFAGVGIAGTTVCRTVVVAVVVAERPVFEIDLIVWVGVGNDVDVEGGDEGFGLVNDAGEFTERVETIGEIAPGLAETVLEEVERHVVRTSHVEQSKLMA